MREERNSRGSIITVTSLTIDTVKDVQVFADEVQYKACQFGLQVLRAVKTLICGAGEHVILWFSTLG